MLSAVVLLATSFVLPYPGTTYVGELKGKEGSCRVAAWEGIAPALWLFTDQEKKELEAILRDGEMPSSGQEEAKRKAALGRFLRLVQNKGGQPPLMSSKQVYVYSLTLSCGDDSVRAALAVLPQLYGTALVAVHPSTGRHLWIGDFWAGEFLVKLPGYEELPESTKKRVESSRSLSWTIAGRTLPGCAEKCDPAELQAAWAALPPEAQRAFRPLLGALSRTKAEEEGEFTPPAPGTLLLPRLLLTWPAYLGENPFLEAQWEVKALEKIPTFLAPSPALCREIFGTERPQLPQFDQSHPARVFTVLYKSIR